MTKLQTLAPAVGQAPPAPVSAAPSGLRAWVRTGLVGVSLLVLFAPPSLIPTDTFRLGLFAKFMALAIFALSVDLIWGYTGLLSLGQGLFFGIGAYCVAYSLTLQYVAEDKDAPVGTVAPSFMLYTGAAPNDPNYVAKPAALAWIAPLGNIWVALAAAIALPTLAAGLFGLVTFRLRVRGVYFSLVTQALLLAIFTLVRSQQGITGGVVGIKELADLQLFDYTFNAYKKHVRELYYLNAGALLICFLLCCLLVRTKFGKILTAIRDNENRVLALGYNTALYKTFLFALSGGLAGLAGALYVVANQLCGPTYLSIRSSIDPVIWVAVGGRGTLLGPVAGTVLVGFANTYISAAFPRYWTIILGALFIFIVVFLPRGLIAAAGRGALLGAMLGVVMVDQFVKWVDPHISWLGAWVDGLEHRLHIHAEPGSYKVLVGSLFILTMVFIPRGAEYLCRKSVSLGKRLLGGKARLAT